MEKVFHDNGDGTINVSVTYVPEDYTPVINKVINHLLDQVTVKGFRKGKAPKEVAIRYIKDEDVYNGMVDKLINRDFPTLLEGYKDRKEVANIQPKLDIKNDAKKNAYNFLYTFVFLPKAEIKEDKGLGIKEDLKAVSDEDVNKEIEKLAKDQADLVPSKDAAAEGDHVLIDFNGYIDGKEFEGGSAKDYDLTLGSHSFVPGFEEGLVGVKEGDKKTLDITFPEHYLASLANKKAKFSVEVKGVKKVELPKIDDEFAASTSYKVKTVDELKAKIREQLESSAKSTARANKVTAIYEALEKDAKIVISDNYVEASSKNYERQTLNQIKQYGMDLDQYLQLVGQTAEQFHDNAKKQARLDGIRYALIHAVAEKEKIGVGEEDFEKRFGGKKQYEDMKKAAADEEKKNSSFSAAAYFDNLADDILTGKVNDFLYANN